MNPAPAGYEEMHKALNQYSRIARISLALLGLTLSVLSLTTGQIIWVSSLPLILVLTLSQKYMRLFAYLMVQTRKRCRLLVHRHQ